MNLSTFTVTVSLHVKNEDGGIKSDYSERTVTVKARSRHAAYGVARNELERQEAAAGRPTGFALTFLSITRHGDKRPYLQLSPASSYRGADMGRSTILPVDDGAKIRFHLMRCHLDSGGYDAGGAYWGFGTPLYRAISADEVTTKYGAMHAQAFTRAKSRAEAKQHLVNLVPGATFFR